MLRRLASIQTEPTAKSFRTRRIIQQKEFLFGVMNIDYANDTPSRIRIEKERRNK